MNNKGNQLIIFIIFILTLTFVTVWILDNKKSEVQTNFIGPLRQVEMLRFELVNILEEVDSTDESRTAYIFCDKKCGIALFANESDYGMAYYPVPYATRLYFGLEWKDKSIVRFNYSASPWTRVEFEVDVDKALILKSTIHH